VPASRQPASAAVYFFFLFLLLHLHPTLHFYY
jgi:hypothetical protein